MKFPLKKTIVSILAAAILLAPVSPVIQIDESKPAEFSVAFKENKASAQAQLLVSAFNKSTLKIDSKNSNSAIFSGTIIASDTDSCPDCTSIAPSKHLKIYDQIALPSDSNKDPGTGIFFVVQQNSNEIARLPFSGAKGLGWNFVSSATENDFQRNTLDFVKLSPNTTYTIHIEIKLFMYHGLLVGSDYATYDSDPVSFTTDSYNPNDPTTTPYNGNTSTTSRGGSSDIIGACMTTTNIGIANVPSGLNIPNCIAWTTYTIWEATSLIARLAAEILDFFVYYSTNSTSYNNTFISKGWGAVRDVANILFIIILLYIAIETVLGLNAAHNKRLIAMVIVVALVINFSLFATQLVIDSTNILAKVFYNGMNSVNAEGGSLATGVEGQKKISEGIISKYDPQKIITDTATYDSNKGTFILITIILIAVTLYTAWIFFAVAFLFVGRVVSLWIAMVFSPFAFASFALPFDIPGVGHKEWWKRLSENALLAPLFIFFLYLIVMFTGFLNQVISYQNTTNLGTWENLMQHLMATIIPFLIIVGLLREAKKLAVKYSGEFGEALHKAGSAVGGLVVGGTIAAVSGGTALALRGTVGKVGSAMQNSEYLAGIEEKGGAKGWMAARLRDAGKYTGTRTFDARNVKVAGKSLPSGGPKFLSQVREGGNEGAIKRKTEKRQKRAEELATVSSRKEKKELHEAEIALQGILSKFSHDLAQLDKKITSTGAKSTDASRRAKDLNASAKVVEKKAQEAEEYQKIHDTDRVAFMNMKNAQIQAKKAREAADKAQEEASLLSEKLKEYKDHKDAIRKGEKFTATLTEGGQKYNYSGEDEQEDEISKNSRFSYKGRSETIDSFQSERIPEYEHELEKARREAKTDYAESILKHWWGNNMNKADKDAHYNIIMDVKLDDKGGHK